MSRSIVILKKCLYPHKNCYSLAIVKIKPASKKHLLKARLKNSRVHWWLSDKLPRKGGRLPQLNKHNRRQPSELVSGLLASAVEYDTDV
jgi:hypothetical protein